MNWFSKLTQQQRGKYIGDITEIMAYNSTSLEHPNYKDKRLLFLKVKWIWLQIKWRIISYFN